MGRPGPYVLRFPRGPGRAPFRNPFTADAGGALVVDIHETPAVPPMEPGGDERLGYYIAGGLLLFLGWGLGVGANLALHSLAGSGGMTFFWVRLSSGLGPYAWAALAFGLFTGAVGAVLVGLATRSPRGPVVLPGFDY